MSYLERVIMLADVLAGFFFQYLVLMLVEEMFGGYRTPEQVNKSFHFFLIQIGRLIVGCLASSTKYFMHIQDES